MRRYLSTCARSTEADPEDCPFSYYSWVGSIDDVKWRITTQPPIVAELTQSGGISVSSTEYGTARITGNATGFFDSTTKVDEEQPFSVSGSLQWDGGDPATATFSTESAGY